jgi:transposase
MMESSNLEHLSTGETTYWPSDKNILLELVDFMLQRTFLKTLLVQKSCFDLSSNHSPILITLTADALNQENEQVLSNRNTNWDDFRHFISERLALDIPLKTEKDIKAAAMFINDTVQCAGWNAMPEHKTTLKAYDCPIIIKQKIENKIRLHRKWRHLQTPTSKRLHNRETQELQELLNNSKNDCIQTFLQGLTPTESTAHSLWKAIKKLKHQKPSTTVDNTRNLGEKQHRKSTCFC